MSNFIDAVMVMLNPLRAGTADFIDAKFAQYIRPVLNGQGLPGYAGAPARVSVFSRWAALLTPMALCCRDAFGQPADVAEHDSA